MAGHPYNRLLIMNNLLLGWFACVHRRHELQGVEWRSIMPTNLVATATSLEGSKKLQIVHLRPIQTL